MRLQEGLFPSSSENPAVLRPVENLEGIKLEPSSTNFRPGHDIKYSNLSSQMSSPTSTSTPDSTSTAGFARLSTDPTSKMLQTSMPSSISVCQVDSESGLTTHYIAASAEPRAIGNHCKYNILPELAIVALAKLVYIAPIYQSSHVSRDRLVEIITKAVEGSILWNEESKKHQTDTSCISLFRRSQPGTDGGLSFVIKEEFAEAIRQIFDFKPYSYRQEANSPSAVSKPRRQARKPRVQPQARKACIKCRKSKRRCNEVTPCITLPPAPGSLLTASPGSHDSPTPVLSLIQQIKYGIRTRIFVLGNSANIAQACAPLAVQLCLHQSPRPPHSSSTQLPLAHSPTARKKNLLPASADIHGTLS